MIFEWRSYRFAPGRAMEYLATFEREGLSLVTRHLPMLGYWLTECGELNTLHHLWVYEDLADRAARRVRLAADSEWTGGFGPRAFPMIEHQRGLLLASLARSPGLEAAIATAGAGPMTPARGGDLILGSWLMLEVARSEPAAVPGTESVGSWRVLVGDHPGDHLRLSRFGTEADFGGAADAPPSRRELLRPARFSPVA